MKHLLGAALIGASLLLPGLALAAPGLTVTYTDAAGKEVVTEYSAEDLLALDPVEIKTKNDYVDQMTTFKGPLMRSLLEDADLKPEDSIEVTALNDYKTTIPAREVLDYDVIVAVLMNGEEMSVRDKGPFWVIYPMSDHPELQEPGYNDRLIWQLSRVTLLNDG